MTKHLYLTVIALAAAGSLYAADPIAIDFVPVNMQYMCKPGALPSTDVLVFNLSECDFFPDHSPKGAGWTLALEAVGPLSNTSVNEDPGVPVGKYTVGYGWDETGKYVPFTLRNYSEARQIVAGPQGAYSNRYEIYAGEMELAEEDGKYYISGLLEGSAYSLDDKQEITITIPRTEVDPQYNFFGYPEVDEGYTMENPGLVGSYTVQTFRNSARWCEYSLEFYTAPLDASMTVDGEGAVLKVILCTELYDNVTPEKICGEYALKNYLCNTFDAFDVRGGFLMETDLVFGSTQGSRITLFDDAGYPIKSSFADEGTNVKLSHLGEGDNFRVEVEMVNQFGQSTHCTYEGPIFAKVKDAPTFSAGIDQISTSIEAPAEYFDLTGKRIEGTPDHGIYIIRHGDKVSKTSIK